MSVCIVQRFEPQSRRLIDFICNEEDDGDDNDDETRERRNNKKEINKSPTTDNGVRGSSLEIRTGLKKRKRKKKKSRLPCGY